jgi:hypothetical protein
MQVKVTVTGIEELQARLKLTFSEIMKIVTRASAEWFVGNASHGLKHEPYYKYVNRYAGFPNLSYTTSAGKVVPGFASARQHRFIMAQIAKGKIIPGQDNRTHALTEGWKYIPQGIGYVVKNDTSYAKYVQGLQPTRMHSLIGWRSFMDVVQTNFKGAARHAQAAINEWLRAHKR